MPIRPDVIQRYYGAFNSGDIDAQLALMAEDVRHDVNQGGTRRGKAAFRAFSDHMARTCDERCEDVVVMVAPDVTRASAEFWVHGIYRATERGMPKAEGQRYLIRAGAFFEIERGLITRITTYYNMTDWRRQVAEGVSPGGQAAR